MTGSLTRSTIVVVTWRGKGHVGACLDAVAAQTRPHRLLVIDNASDDGTAEVLASHPSSPSVIRLPENVGYAGALAAATVGTEFTAWLNDDAMPAPTWLAELEDALDEAPSAAAAGSRMVALDGSVISLGVGLTPDGHGVDLVSPADPMFGFCGGAVLLRTAALRSVGGVPERFFCYYEDTDTAWRLRLHGHTIVAVPSAEVTHRHGASTQPGSRQFHLWNERNRLAMLIRCAPASVAVREVARFAAITALLPLRRLLAATKTRPDQAIVDNSPRTTRNRRWHRVALKSGGPRGHESPIRSGSPGESVAGGAPRAGKRRWHRVALKPGDPQAHESPTRSDSPGEPSANGASRTRNRRWHRVASKPGDPQAHESPTRSGSPGENGVPWNFRVGLRVRVLWELLLTVRPLLAERRTISRGIDVPRIVVWRRARSVNSAS